MQKNKSFFTSHIPSYLPLINATTKNYSISIDESGLNIINADGEVVYDIVNGFSTIFDTNAQIAQNPINNNNWHKIYIDTLIGEQELDRVPITGKIAQRIKNTVSKASSFQKGLIDFDAHEQMPTTIIYGLLSGLFLEELINKYEHFHSLFIYEPHEELFTLSCYFVDYESLFNKTNQESFYIVIRGKLNPQIVKDFFGTRLITTTYFRLEYSAYAHPLIDDAKNLVDEISKTSTRGWGTYEDEIIGVQNKLSWCDGSSPKYPILTQKIQTPMPICVVGNGPSLNENLEFLRQNAKKFIIFSAGSTLKVLKKHHIEPDFHVEIERMDHVKDWLKDANLGDTQLIAADVVHPSTLEVAKNPFVFIRGASCAQNMFSPKLSVDFANPLVGNACLALAMNFTNEIYLLGMDMGFKQDGKKHAKGSLYDTMDDKSEEFLPTRGNFSSNVYTNSLFSLSKIGMESLIKNQDVGVYNLSDGVFIQGAKPLHPSKLHLKNNDKNQAIKDIKACFVQENVFASKNEDYNKHLRIYKKELFELLLSKQIKTKKDLFRIIDFAFFFTAMKRRDESVSGTLVCGSMWHILNSLFVNLLQIDTKDLQKSFTLVIKEIEKDFKEFTL